MKTHHQFDYLVVNSCIVDFDLMANKSSKFSALLCSCHHMIWPYCEQCNPVNLLFSLFSSGDIGSLRKSNSVRLRNSVLNELFIYLYSSSENL